MIVSFSVRHTRHVEAEEAYSCRSPGVGAFAAGMQALKLGWESWIKKVWCKADRPLLGICLGMQLLASEGTEGIEGWCYVRS